MGVREDLSHELETEPVPWTSADPSSFRRCAASARSATCARCSGSAARRVASGQRHRDSAEAGLQRALACAAAPSERGRPGADRAAAGAAPASPRVGSAQTARCTAAGRRAACAAGDLHGGGDREAPRAGAPRRRRRHTVPYGSPVDGERPLPARRAWRRLRRPNRADSRKSGVFVCGMHSTCENTRNSGVTSIGLHGGTRKGGGQDRNVRTRYALHTAGRSVRRERPSRPSVDNAWSRFVASAAWGPPSARIARRSVPTSATAYEFDGQRARWPTGSTSAGESGIR